MFLSGMTKSVNALSWLQYQKLAQTIQEWDNFDKSLCFRNADKRRNMLRMDYNNISNHTFKHLLQWLHYGYS